MLTHGATPRTSATGEDLRAGLENAPDWGPWRLHPPTRVLVLIGEGRRHDTGLAFEDERYEVDLERCLTSSQVLDWVCQVARKGWADDATVAGLVRALGDVIDPQAQLCTWGSSKEVTAERIAGLVEAAARRRPDLVLRRAS